MNAQRLVFVALASLISGVSDAMDEHGVTERTQTMPVQLIHTADLYHPPCDPDDHWDVASLYALVKMGRVELLGVVIDHPLPPDENGIVPMGAGEPAVQAIAQLNYITGSAVVPAVGTGIPFQQAFSGNGKCLADFRAARFILETLRRASQPVVISIAGSCRDVAIASKFDPGLFQEKCAGIYLNAGAAFSSLPGNHDKEWNVALDPAAYRQIFEIPCPIYWMPCFDDLARFESHAHGSYWRFRQGDVLDHLSPAVQNYFLYALSRSTDQRWLSQILGGVNSVALEIQSKSYRNMWCTAGFLHLAGLTVTRAGDLVPRFDIPESETLFHFRPVRISWENSGANRWEPTDQPGRHFLFEVNDVEKYKSTMPTILRKLLEKL
ncbi:MAG TPA: hypothetical protein PKY35_08420 [Candidatus Hydrogenedentes bacterium]|nr:hypothetical protein [Candidatus Hydrogenedentota bacterium]HOL77039.1 hypothetical protein [Candidatus Hydrogenedentota bacterium]HPO85778.1 hypothetical protein [Candidatus Hydrogenedentota bacterium]